MGERAKVVRAQVGLQVEALGAGQLQPGKKKIGMCRRCLKATVV